MTRPPLAALAGLVLMLTACGKSKGLGHSDGSDRTDAATETKGDALATVKPVDAATDSTSDALDASTEASATGGDSETDSDADVDDAGPTNPINAGNWNETTLFPLAKRRMLLFDQGNVQVCLLDLGDATKSWCTVIGDPWARGIQLVGNDQLLIGTQDGYDVLELTTGAVVKKVTGFANTQSAYRMANGETMLTTSGTVLQFLNEADVVAHQISYPGHGNVRVARPTRNGTFLVPSDTTVFEGDASGNVLWKLTAGAVGWSDVWEPLLMKSGDVLLSTNFGHSLDLIDKTTHTVTRSYGINPQLTNAASLCVSCPNYFTEFQILPNGDIVAANWQGHGGGLGNSGVQVIEFDPLGAVAWFYKQDPKLYSSIQAVMVIDGLDPRYLHVQETSSDSTWQPVIPTP